MKFFRAFLLVAFIPVSLTHAETLHKLLEERLKSIVVVEFTIEAEIESVLTKAFGTVADDQGTIILPGASVSSMVPASQLKEFKVYRPNSTESFSATYLGQDALTKWHFVRAEAKMLPFLVPVTRFTARNPVPLDLGDELWGISLRNKDENFIPCVFSSRVVLIPNLSNKTAITAQGVAGPGLPVFNRAGEFFGLAENSLGKKFFLFSARGGGYPVVLMNFDESNMVMLADVVEPWFKRIPKNVNGRPIPWLGVYGFQLIDPSVAKLLKLQGQSGGAVLSDIMEGSPAAEAGLKDRDIAFLIDGKPLPHFRPDSAVIRFVGQEILSRRPGDKMRFTVLRGLERKDITVTLGDRPKMEREAAHRYFDRLGFVVREFLKADSIPNLTKPDEHSGVIVRFVKPNSPAASAGLEPNVWIRKIDGNEIPSYHDAVTKLAAIETNPMRREVVLLASCDGKTEVLRIKLDSTCLSESSKK